MDAKVFSSAVSKFSAKFCNIGIYFCMWNAQFNQNTTKERPFDTDADAVDVPAPYADKAQELKKGTNVVCSPLSAEYILGLMTFGSTGHAHTELLESLYFPSDDTIRSSFTTLTSKLKSIDGVTLHVANRVYLNEGSYILNSNLREDAVNVFDVAFENLNFDDGPNSAREINKWVGSETNGRIKKMLSLDSIDSNSRLVLISAMYFKGMWHSQFNRKLTKIQPFHVDKQSTIDIPMMYKEDTFKYRVSNNLEAQILEMNYKGGQANMVIVLPNKAEGLNAVLQKLADGYDLMSELDKLISTKVQVAIPKFEIETEINLMEILPKLGINAILKKTASGLTKILDNDELLHVTNAVQKVFIQISEEGSETDTGSGIGVMMFSATSTTPQRFRADRPFLFVLTADLTTFLVGVYCGVD